MRNVTKVTDSGKVVGVVGSTRSRAEAIERKRITKFASQHSDQIVDAVELSMFDCESIGICINCGEERDYCEPDARQYECYECERHTVYGASELLL